MANYTDFTSRSGEMLTLREGPDGDLSFTILGADGESRQVFVFDSPEQTAHFARLAGDIAGVSGPPEERLPIVCVERDGAYAGDGTGRVNCTLEADVAWLQNRAEELREQAEHYLASYRNTAALAQWRLDVIEEEQATLARTYFGPDLTGLPAGARDLVRDLYLAQKSLKKLRAPRER
ncbi:hypothetical protein [Arthrobacter caoxuetaonis]|uniref:Uncharacterized protein n=1 Tax=Arthrobacter caoxuetaonis TaxID=2886935 RepID=A0A9X1MFW9_9MICC|nr:hypothetical protein [Arthrobacter caoxuetaonis]MCC3299388.1 hypothetical protein [Arthrobacter caoxuetaonis]USQ59119.1 hypothetical protein NF551_18610 [Arthrobacter caoxuetaonis]